MHICIHIFSINELFHQWRAIAWIHDISIKPPYSTVLDLSIYTEVSSILLLFVGPTVSREINSKISHYSCFCWYSSCTQPNYLCRFYSFQYVNDHVMPVELNPTDPTPFPVELHPTPFEIWRYHIYSKVFWKLPNL